MQTVLQRVDVRWFLLWENLQTRGRVTAPLRSPVQAKGAGPADLSSPARR